MNEYINKKWTKNFWWNLVDVFVECVVQENLHTSPKVNGNSKGAGAGKSKHLSKVWSYIGNKPKNLPWEG